MNARMLLAPLGASLLLATPMIASAASKATSTSTSTTTSHKTSSMQAPSACAKLTGKKMTDCMDREAHKTAPKS